MKIITILGSPKKNGNTAAVLAQFERLVEPVHQVERIDLVDHWIGGCQDCGRCQEVADEPGCAQHDDVAQIMEQIEAADLVLYATPVFCWGFPTQMKALIERHYCLVKFRRDGKSTILMPGKRAALLATCGGPAQDDADLIQTTFQRQMAYLHWTVAGMYVVDDCGGSGVEEKAAATAARMATELG